MLYYLFLSVFLMISLTINAQKTDDISASKHKKLGFRFEMAGDKYSAIEHYSAFIKKNPKNRYYHRKLAFLYLDIRNYQLAEFYFEQTIKFYKNPPSELLYHYGRVLKMNGKYEEAKKTLSTFRKKSGTKSKNENLKKLAKTEIEGCDMFLKGIFADTTRNIVINALDSSVNKSHSDFAPFPINENKLIYSSVRTNEVVFFTTDSEKYSELSKFYYAKRINGIWKGGEKITDSFNLTGKNTGNGYMNPGGNKLYFTVCERNEENKFICGIWFSEIINNHWTTPTRLPKVINKPGTNNTQPAIGYEPRQNREVLYFVSDRKGGKGGLDIWYSIYNPKTNTFSEPKNCGSKINTPMNEATPFIDLSTNKFYFSSEGHVGMGGYDVFSTSGALRKWEEPVNAGLPLNSSVDDLWFRTIPDKPEEGFLVSNRGGGPLMAGLTCCDDIFHFIITHYIFLKISGRVVSFENSNPELYIEDFIDNPAKSIPKEGKLLDSASVSLFLISGDEEIPLKTQITRQDGKYLLRLESGNTYKITASKSGYFSSSFSLSTHHITRSDSFFHDFVLNKIPVKPIIVRNIYYQFDKFNLTDSAKMIIDSTIYPLMRDNPEITVEISSHTDSKGSDNYNLTLSQKRAQSVVNYLISKGIDSFRLTAKGYGESCPVAPNVNPDGTDNPEGRAKNRRTEFKVIGSLPEFQKIFYDE